MDNHFYGNIDKLVQAGTANINVSTAGEGIWQMFGHFSDDEILHIRQQMQDEIIALKHKGLQCGLSGIFVILTYAGLFYFDVYRLLLGGNSIWGMGLAVLCLVAWVTTMGNAIKHDIEPKINKLNKLKKDCECLDDIIRYRQYVLLTQHNKPLKDD